MPERIDVDVCVVGAGYAGLSTALELHREGKSVVVLEARDRIWGAHLDPSTCQTAHRSTGVAPGWLRGTMPSSDWPGNSQSPPSAPVRSIVQHADHADVVADRHLGVGAPRRGERPSRARPRYRLRPGAAARSDALYSSAFAGPESKTLVVYPDPFWRADGLSGQSAGPGSAAEVTLDASPAAGRPGVLASFTFGSVAERVASLAG